MALWTGGSQVLDGEMTVGVLLESIWLLGMALGPIEGLGGLYNECLVAGAVGGADLPAARHDARDPGRPGRRDPGRLAGEVEFENVDFSYEPDGGGGAPARRTSRSTRGPGERVALVGHTGAGKTSVLNLLARFYEPQAGSIRFDGRDARTITDAPRSTGRWASCCRRTSCSRAACSRTCASWRPSLTEARGRGGLRRRSAAARSSTGSPQGLSTEVGRAGREPLGGRAADRLLRARAARRAVDPHPRRGDERGGHAHGGAAPAAPCGRSRRARRPS